MFLTRNFGISLSISFLFINFFQIRNRLLILLYRLSICDFRNRRRTNDFIERIPLAVVESHLFQFEFLKIPEILEVQEFESVLSLMKM